MNGLPTTLNGSAPVLNQAGQNTSTGNSNNATNNLAGALNAGYLASGDINSPLAGLQQSATQSANSYLTSSSNSDAHPILSANGQWVNSATGQAWHGSYQNPNGTTQYFSNGQQVNDIGQVGNQLPNISVQQIQKNPAISSQVAGAVASNANSTGLLSKSFNDYLNEANQVAAQTPAQLSAAEKAINPTGTINTLNQNVATTGSQLNANLGNLTAEQRANLANIAAANQGYQNTTTANLQNLGTTLGTEQQNYATAAQNVANQAYAAAAKQASLYHLTGGTPTSNSGALDNRYLGAYANINTPLQAQLAQMTMGDTRELYGLGAGLQGQYLANAANLYGQTGNVNTQLAGQANANTQYMSGLTSQTAQQIQALQQQVAGLQPQLAMQYLQAMGIPQQTAQQIIAGNTANLQGLTNLDASANAYNFVAPANLNYPSYTTPRLNMPAAVANPYNTSTGTGGNGILSSALATQNNYLAGMQNPYYGGYATLPTATGTGPYGSPANNYGGVPQPQALGNGMYYDPGTQSYMDAQGNPMTMTAGGQLVPTTNTYPNSQLGTY